jgi:hypothetical protein
LPSCPRASRSAAKSLAADQNKKQGLKERMEQPPRRFSATPTALEMMSEDAKFALGF